MLYRDICKLLGVFFVGLTAVMLIPMAVAFYFDYFADQTKYPQPHSGIFFVQTQCFTLILGSLLYYIGRNASGQIYRREGLAVVVLIWFLTPAISALPFILSDTFENPFAAYFEMVSGITATGSTVAEGKRFDSAGQEIPIVHEIPQVIPVTYKYFGTMKPVRDPETGKVLREGIEAMSMGLVFWRSFIQWLGGGGVVVLFVALLPAIAGGGGRLLFTSEVAGPIKDTLTPRVRETAVKLWGIYVLLTVFEIVLLMATNPAMEFLDAITISFTALATGGFSIRNANIGYYQNAHTEWVVILCMTLGAINFSIYYYMIKGKIFRLYDPELFLYLLLIVGSSVLASYFLVGEKVTLLTGEETENLSRCDALRYAAFQVVSCHTTTGFSTANYESWPYPIQVIMLMVMYFGGMSGSTAAGIKSIRLILLFKAAQFKVESLFRPDNVRPFRLAGREVDSNVIIMVLCFFLIIASISAFSTFLFVLDGLDPETALGTVACMINGVGMSFRAGGPVNSFAFLSDFGLLLSSFLMILGRLEFFVVLAVLVPAFWRKNS